MTCVCQHLYKEVIESPKLAGRLSMLSVETNKQGKRTANIQIQLRQFP